MREKGTITMRVLFLSEGKTWVAQCIEYDIAAQGHTFEEVQKNFERTFVGHILLDLSRGKEPLEDIPPAPDFYRERFERAGKFRHEEKAGLSSFIPPVHIIEAISREQCPA